VEFQGAEAARPWLEGTSFPTVVDASNVLGTLLGYKAIPNGILLDEAGVVRYSKFSGFSVVNRDDVAAIERLLAEESGGAEHAGARSPVLDRGQTLITAGRPDLVEARLAALQEGLERLRRSDRAGAIAAWREALAHDPDNFVIRKQIWAIEHPERFYPTIDWAWQREQLASERAAEQVTRGK
jgi:hypothetical protein